MSYNKDELRKKMQAAFDALHKEFGGLRTGRASTALLDHITVEAYGGRSPLNSLGGVSAPESRMLAVQVWDQSLVKAVEKAIRDSGLGLNPQSDGSLVRIPIPPLSEERRKEMGKIASSYAEKGRLSVRNVRRDFLDLLKKSEKDGDISQDDHKKASEEIQKVTDEFIHKIDDMLKQKETEIMQV